MFTIQRCVKPSRKGVSFRERKNAYFSPRIGASSPLRSGTIDRLASPFYYTVIKQSSMAANSQGIQTLLEAEKEAAKVVQKARQYRVQKLKDARSEAAKEIEEYKAKKEAEYKKFESENSSQTSSSQSTIDQSTEKQLGDIESNVKQNRDKTIKKIVERVLQCEPHMHANLKKVEA